MAAFAAVTALLFAACTTVTIVWCTSMSAMGGMPMPGGWKMSMVWTGMPGQSWAVAGLSFLAMWTVMMAAMMLPAIIPALWRYRETLRTAGESHTGRLTLGAGAGYFFIWVAVGIVVFPLGSLLASIEMAQPAIAGTIPMAVGAIVMIAGMVQFTECKKRQLACCRETPGGAFAADARSAWWHGIRLGVECVRCCGNLMAIVLVLGVMDVRTMALVAAAVTLERTAPARERVASAIGGLAVVAGAFLIIQRARP